MAGELGIGKAELERRFAASLLRSGAPIEDAHRMAQTLADDFHRDFAGKRVTVRIERAHLRVLTPEERKRIFMAWWIDRTEDHILCTDNKISPSTLFRIKRDGRAQKWAERR